MASNGVPTSAPVSPEATPRRPPSGTSAQAIAEQFSHQYYTVFSNYPRYLHRFYDQASVQNIVEVAENGTIREETAGNQKDIHDVIQRLFGEAKARVDHVSSQFSQNGGVMIQVAGILFRRGRPDSNFVQSFFLAVQERGFFVLNDLLRISPSYASGTASNPARNEQSTMRNAEGVPQPRTPRDGVSFGVPAARSALPNGATVGSSVPDPEQINQILAETKQVLSATVPNQPTDNPSPASQQTYSELLRRSSSSAQGTPVVQSPHAQQRSPLHAELQSGNEVPSQSPVSNAHSGFLLNPRRRSANGSLPALQRNTSIFVRDVPNNIEEKNLREIFEQFGTVTSVMIRTGKREARFAFIDFSETSAMEKALTAELFVSGKRLLIEEKKPLVLRNKPRFTNARANGDGSFGGSMDSSHGNGGGMRLGMHPYR